MLGSYDPLKASCKAGFKVAALEMKYDHVKRLPRKPTQFAALCHPQLTPSCCARVHKVQYMRVHQLVTRVCESAWPLEVNNPFAEGGAKPLWRASTRRMTQSISLMLRQNEQSVRRSESKNQQDTVTTTSPTSPLVSNCGHAVWPGQSAPREVSVGHLAASTGTSTALTFVSEPDEA